MGADSSKNRAGELRPVRARRSARSGMPVCVPGGIRNQRLFRLGRSGGLSLLTA